MLMRRLTLVHVIIGMLLLPTVLQAAVFSAEQSFGWLEAQCELGPRTPGSEGHSALQDMITGLADSLGLSWAKLKHEAVSPLTGEVMPLAEIIVSIGPPGGRRLWVGAHYDTRAVADQDPDPANRSQAIIGANDGASGVAVLMHLMEVLAEEAPAIGVDLLFLDGEDQGRPSEPLTFCLGSEWLAARCRDFGHPLAGGDPVGVVIVDMVADQGVTIPMEGQSLRYAGTWTRQVFDRAASLGLDVFVPEPGRAVHDDHVPFLRQGIPAVDLIDFHDESWHTVGDVPESCSPRGLGQVGTLILDLCRHPIR